MITESEIAEWKTKIAEELEAQGFGPRDIRLFLAGAVMFGHLRPGGVRWQLEHAFRTRLRPLAATDTSLESAGSWTRP